MLFSFWVCNFAAVSHNMEAYNLCAALQLWWVIVPTNKYLFLLLVDPTVPFRVGEDEPPPSWDPVLTPKGTEFYLCILLHFFSSFEGPQEPQCIFPLRNALLIPFWVGTPFSEINKEAIVLLHHSSLVKLIWTSLIIGVSITDLRNLCGPPTIIQLLSYGSETSSDQIHINHVLLLTCSSDPVAKIKLG